MGVALEDPLQDIEAIPEEASYLDKSDKPEYESVSFCTEDGTFCEVISFPAFKDFYESFLPHRKVPEEKRFTIFKKLPQELQNII